VFQPPSHKRAKKSALEELFEEEDQELQAATSTTSGLSMAERVHQEMNNAVSPIRKRPCMHRVYMNGRRNLETYRRGVDDTDHCVGTDIAGGEFPRRGL